MTRKFIRSHVMRGKNTRSDVRARRMARLESSMASKQTVAGNQSTDKHDEDWVLTSPHIIASELSLFGYGYLDDMKPYMLDLIHRAFTFVKPSTYTIETVLVEGTSDRLYCLSNLPQHPAMVHSFLFTAQAFHDLSCGGIYGGRAQFHLSKALLHLQKCINDAVDATATSTMAVVTTLATAAAILGDLETAEKHMAGLHQMVSLRGGLKMLGSGSMIEHKAQRIDLGLAIGTGSKARFFEDSVSWGPQIAQGKAIRQLTELNMLSPRPDPRLLNIWVDAREFSRAVNHATAHGVRMKAEYFSRLSTSVPCRLLNLQFDPGSTAELVRLAMLAYVKRILVQIPGIGKKMTFLANGLEVALLAQEYPPAPDVAGLLLWALFISTVSIFEGLDRDWARVALLQTVSSLGLQTWEEARRMLKSFLWVDAVFDTDAERLFQQLFEIPEDGVGGFEASDGLIETWVNGMTR